ncbi:pilus assembly protein [Thermodesulfobacteriota bacterium]
MKRDRMNDNWAGAIRGIILIALFTLSLSSVVFEAGPAWAEERDFGSGSLIIPMASTWQSDDDGGIFEAYGLVYYLLESGVTVYWSIGQNKSAIDEVDLTISDITTSPIVRLYDHNGGHADLAGVTNTISYAGGPFLVDDEDAVLAKKVIDESNWDAVEVHQSLVPFAANIYREMEGAPPTLALMNNQESLETGNVDILESYLRLGGICGDCYEVITPNMIRDGWLDSDPVKLLWAPHWTGSNKDNDGDGELDDLTITNKVGAFIDRGGAVFAECASIEIFEHYGLFLTTNDFGHNGGTNDQDDIYHDHVEHPFAQIGDSPFKPMGGHLHNWRPFRSGDDNKIGVPSTPPESEYNNTVMIFTYDDADHDLGTTDDQWDYFVGGRKDGNSEKGYVVYLGGHRYATCGLGHESSPTQWQHEWKLELEKNTVAEEFTLTIEFDGGSSQSAVFNKTNYQTVKVGATLEIDLTGAKMDKNKIEKLSVNNLGNSAIEIDAVTLSWTGGSAEQKWKKLEDKTADVKILDKAKLDSGTRVEVSDVTIDTANPGASAGGCTDNDDCAWKSIAGVRYVLNTLFFLQYTVVNHEFTLSAPIVNDGELFQGSYEYPSYRGHLRAYDMTESTQTDAFRWDSADEVPSSAARKVYTNIPGSTDLINFSSANIASLRSPIDLTPANGDDTDELELIQIIRGKKRQPSGVLVEKPNRLGAIVHSSPLVIHESDFVGTERDTKIFVGTFDGMLECLDASDGTEEWTYIPGRLLDKLQNDRTDPTSINDYASVDASPTAKDVYIDGEWKTYLVNSEGVGGYSIFAMDITDPDDPELLWEKTDKDGDDQVMGHAYRTAIGRLLVDGSLAYYVFLSTGFPNPGSGNGGIHIYAYNLETGDKVWKFTSQYADSVNDIPGALTAVDVSGNGFVDRVYVGDMNGRLWELNAVDGSNPNGTDGFGREIPLFNAGVGNPISASPAVVNKDERILVLFGTGGAEWASDDASYVLYAIDVTHKKATPTYADGAGTIFWSEALATGEKLWAAPIYSGGMVYFVTSFGSMESNDPNKDRPAEGEASGNLHVLDIETGDEAWTQSDIGKVRGSLYIDDEHLYFANKEAQVIQVGSNTFDNEITSAIVKKRPGTWHQLK